MSSLTLVSQSLLLNIPEGCSSSKKLTVKYCIKMKLKASILLNGPQAFHFMIWTCLEEVGVDQTTFAMSAAFLNSSFWSRNSHDQTNYKPQCLFPSQFLEHLWVSMNMLNFFRKEAKIVLMNRFNAIKAIADVFRSSHTDRQVRFSIVLKMLFDYPSKVLCISEYSLVPWFRSVKR